MMQPKGKHETTEYKLSKAIIQNCFYSKCVVQPVWGALVSTVHNVVPPVTEGLKVSCNFL